MTMDLNVTITLSDRLFQLLEDKLPDIQKRAKAAVGKQVKKIALEETEVEVTVTPIRPKEEPKDDTAELPAELPKPEPKEEPAKPATAKLEERVRDVMHRTRQRIEGLDYMTNTTSDGYKRYHKALNNEFRRIASTLGYDKPSLIDDEEKAVRFAKECDALVLDEKGEITINLPF